MKQHLPWLLGSTLLGMSFTPAEAQLLDRLFGPPPPPMEEMEELPPPRLRGNPYAYERVIPEEAYPEDPEVYTEDPRRIYESRERREAAPREQRRDRARRAARESREAAPSEAREAPPRKSSAKAAPRRKAEDAISEAKHQEDAQKALHHVELARTYFLQNPPAEGTEEKAKVAVIAGQSFPEDLKMNPLPGEIAFEVSAACPANYFAWGEDIVLADPCTRRAIAIIGMDGSQQTAAKEPERKDIGIFYDKLGSHGTWVRHRDHNYVFVPAVEKGWRPYVDGRWVWTGDHGWYWHSDEPFAWATYHYGRWGFEADYGWYWVPGNLWAPAWVTWRRGGGYVGWAPLGPPGKGLAIGFAEHHDPAALEAWIFVPEQHFLEARVNRYVVAVAETKTILKGAGETFEIAERNGNVVNAFLAPDQATDLFGAEIEPFKLTSAKDPSGVSLSDGAVASFKVDLAATDPGTTPKRVASDPEDIEARPVLRETAKGEPPAAARSTRSESNSKGPVGRADGEEPSERAKSSATVPSEENRSSVKAEPALPKEGAARENDRALAKEGDVRETDGRAAPSPHREPEDRREARPQTPSDEAPASGERDRVDSAEEEPKSQTRPTPRKAETTEEESPRDS